MSPVPLRLPTASIPAIAVAAAPEGNPALRRPKPENKRLNAGI